MAKRRKPISFDTTLRNPSRIPKFISILVNYEGRVVDNQTALELEGEIIRQKIFEPTKATLGTYTKVNNKYHFIADDQSETAKKLVDAYYHEWADGDPGQVNLDKIVYLLKNTFTSHKESGWDAGWESRIHTQFNFLNELGFVKVVKGEQIRISDNGKLMIKEYRDGKPISDHYDETYEQSAFLNAFAKYQINNPYRSNTIKVNFFPLVLNTIKYLDDTYARPGIAKQDLPFIIAWGSNEYKILAEYIHKFRDKFGYNTSDEFVYEYAMNLMDEKTSNDYPEPASDTFIASKKKDYKFEKIIRETPDEIVRKLRLTMLISLRGAGRFIDINTNEATKIAYTVKKYSTNIDFSNEVDAYFDYMGKTDTNLAFAADVAESQETLDKKEKTVANWALNHDWKFLKEELMNSAEKHPSTDETLKYVKETARLEFLVAIVVKKALPKNRVIANYKADDEGIPFNTASGSKNNKVGADIDVYENSTHVLVEPTIAKSRSFQVEHELPSIRSHVLATANQDVEDSNFNNWFAVFVAPNIVKDVGDQIPIIKETNSVEIYPWTIEDFVDFSENITSLDDYKIIRLYARPQQMPKLK
ncbi:AlwI family type II restriction endonuclease [Pediococcus ethanolidurans]|uniref:AlwI family type II restriction endonuclease n=1 Tax=Pediococcus ethanolidurans TaxID=319653 RepID=UPI0021E9A8A4|nr:AlwI family type II restriction endonuclease [Pediococcus ethanolidurans]MCV3327746.1 AlwI family type II restriction endonuclease [Pediococcus ethanolidurans]